MSVVHIVLFQVKANAKPEDIKTVRVSCSNHRFMAHVE